MRLLRDRMTIANGTQFSNPITLGAEQLVGIYIQQAPGGGGGTDLRFQSLVAGDIDDPVANQTWVDISLTQTDNVPTGGYLSFVFKIAIAEITTGKMILFPRPQAGYPLPIIRLAAQANVTGASLLAKLITDPGE